jgi:hypothetical protein
MKQISTYLLLLPLILMVREASAQKDTLKLLNKDIIVGEVKAMERGIVTVETDYSKEDFRVEWKGVEAIYTTSQYNATLMNGTRLTGRLRSSAPGSIAIWSKTDEEIACRNEELVDFKLLDDQIIDRFHAAIDVGFSLTKAQNLKQVTVQSKVGYLSEHWSADLNYDHIFSSRSGVEPVRRTDGGFTFNYFLQKDWFIPFLYTFLSNREQKIELRSLGNLGIGNYVIHTNHSYLGFAGGFSYNHENYTDASTRQSWEAFLGTEYNIFDLGDLSLHTRLVVYPGITVPGRWRSDFTIDTKYDLPHDFYLKFTATYSFDNRPVAGATENDYLLQTGFGWKW